MEKVLRWFRSPAPLPTWAPSLDIQAEHVSEAIQYRNLDRQFWI